MPLNSHAVIAYPQPITVTQPDGSRITIRIHGDEYFNYTTTVDGYTVARRSDGFFYYADYDTGTLRVSTARAGAAGTTRSLVGSRGVPATVARRIADENRQKAQITRTAQAASTTAAAAAAPATKQLVILARHSDTPFVTAGAQAAFGNMLNQQGYSAGGGTGSAKDYFRDNSMGRFDPDFTVAGPVTLPNTMAFYSFNQSNTFQMILDACSQAASGGLVNFADFDTDGDGWLDNLSVIYSGYSPAEGGPANNIWPHTSSVAGLGGSIFNGIKVGPYSCVAELRGASGGNMTGIGTFCHEFGHYLNMPDLYNTKGGQGIGFYTTLALMHAGNYNNNSNTPPALTGLERYLLGWGNIQKIDHTTRSIAIEPVASNKTYMIRTNNEGEFFLLDNRQLTGWDRYISAIADPTAHGLLICHIDSSKTIVGGYPASTLWSYNLVNSVPDHQCATIISPRGTVRWEDVHKLFFPGSAPITGWALNGWGGIPVGIDISDIAENGNITLTLTSTGRTSIGGTVTNTSGNALPDVAMTLTQITQGAAAREITVGDFKYSVSSLQTTTRALTEVTTDNTGRYIFDDIAPGSYTIEANKYGYPPATGAITARVGGNRLDFVLQNSEEISTSTLRWFQYLLPTYALRVPAAANSFMFGSLWRRDDLAAYTGQSIKNVSWYTFQNCEFTVKIFFDNALVFSKRAKATVYPGFTTVDLSADDISIPADRSMRVAFDMTKYTPNTELWGMDNSPTVAGKANLLSSDNGATWTEITNTANPGNGNQMIAVTVEDQTQIEGQISIRAIVGQRYADLELFGPSNSSARWFVQWKNVASGASSAVTEVTTPGYMIGDLMPNTQYEIRAAETAEGLNQTNKYASKTIATLPLTEPFAAIANVRYSYDIGARLRLRLTNTPTATVAQIWKMDGEVIAGTDITLNRTGEHTLSVEITYSDNKTETITRIIRVQ